MLFSVTEMFEVASVALMVELRRRTWAPEELLAKLRERGHRSPSRDKANRLRLRRAIRLLDRCFPPGPNCYRRVLMEIAMDAGAAGEPLHLGLQKKGSPASGHAWLGSNRDSTERYDAEFVV
jgi:hypothetical protein